MPFKLRSNSFLMFAFLGWLLGYGVAQAQNCTQRTTHFNDAKIVNSVFQKWGIRADQSQWNISGELCSGDALDNTPAVRNVTLDSPSHNPFIKCTCSYDNGSTCRVIGLKVNGFYINRTIPDELWNLTFLSNLNLFQNYLTGSLSSIGNLNQMQYINLGINALSGVLPKELGLLIDLRSLGLGKNNFSGSLPFELGNLSKLEKLYVDSAGVSGEIPSSFANLQNLETVDLSSNRISGPIPDSLFNLRSLTLLLIGNNRLNGTLPVKKVASLQTIDVSYNNLVGSLPSWVSEQNLQLNLVANNFTTEGSNRPPGHKNDRIGVIVGIAVGVGVVCLLSVISVFYIVQRKRHHSRKDKELLEIDTKSYNFRYAELKAATDDFNPANKLGEGGFGPVYKGKLSDGRVVAVKQLSLTSRQGKKELETEISTISAVQHRNLVKLYGCCIRGDRRLLVYEYLENKSLDKAVFGEEGKKHLNLDWRTRYDICLGVARGLAYLHEDSRVRIVHRDVKASNILLDSVLVPKISDFGLAKLYDDAKTHISTRVAGTIGYLAPEYALRGHLTEKADVFAFGVVVLEVISGRPNFDSSLDGEKTYLLEWAWQLHESNREVELVDSSISEYDVDALKRVTRVALLCTQTLPYLRPSMSRVVAMLSGDIELTTVSSRPTYLTDWKFRDSSSFMNENAAMEEAMIATEAHQQVESWGNNARRSSQEITTTDSP